MTQNEVTDDHGTIWNVVGTLGEVRCVVPDGDGLGNELILREGQAAMVTRNGYCYTCAPCHVGFSTCGALLEYRWN